jgi:hypothetical protein
MIDGSARDTTEGLVGDGLVDAAAPPKAWWE